MLAALKSARKDAGVSQRKLCKLLGQPYTYVSKIEEGSRRVDVIELVLICEAIGTDARAILEAVIEAMRSTDSAA
jgi:transcriptional regulator with XRE-family HTH domain